MTRYVQSSTATSKSENEVRSSELTSRNTPGKDIMNITSMTQLERNIDDLLPLDYESTGVLNLLH